MNYKMGFIGTGNMGSALASAAVKSDKSAVVSDSVTEKAKALSQKLGCDFASTDEVTSSAQYIFLGVKPQVLPSLLSDIKENLKNRNDRFILVSMAAGVPINKITEMLGFNCPVIRIMPNLPVSLGEGMILYTHNEQVAEEEINGFTRLLEKAGRLMAIEEKFIDAASAISGCGPAFVYMFAEALADGGVACGLTFNQSLELAAQTISGAAKMVLSSNEHPAKLCSDVCSPAGTTIEGVKALEDGKFRATLINAVKASYKRSKELS